jgi:hypothetical protein
MKMARTVHMSDPRRWRAWLAANHTGWSGTRSWD